MRLQTDEGKQGRTLSGGPTGIEPVSVTAGGISLRTYIRMDVEETYEEQIGYYQYDKRGLYLEKKIINKKIKK